MNLQVIQGGAPRRVGSLTDWLTKAAGTVDSAYQAVKPVIQDFSQGSASGASNPALQTQINPQQSISTWTAQQQQQQDLNTNKTDYIVLAAVAAVVIILLLTKK